MAARPRGPPRPEARGVRTGHPHCPERRERRAVRSAPATTCRWPGPLGRRSSSCPGPAPAVSSRDVARRSTVDESHRAAATACERRRPRAGAGRLGSFAPPHTADRCGPPSGAGEAPDSAARCRRRPIQSVRLPEKATARSNSGKSDDSTNARRWTPADDVLRNSQQHRGSSSQDKRPRRRLRYPPGRVPAEGEPDVEWSAPNRAWLYAIQARPPAATPGRNAVANRRRSAGGGQRDARIQRAHSDGVDGCLVAGQRPSRPMATLTAPRACVVEPVRRAQAEVPG